MAGRGSFIESFPLFGYDLDDYDDLFAEKLELLLRLRESERVTWPGRHRAPLDDQGVYPRPLQEPLPGLGRGRRHAGVGRPRRDARACRWRSRSSAGCPSASRRSPSSTARPRAEAGHDPPPALGDQLARLRRRDLASRPRDEFFPAYAAMMNAHRARARLVADDGEPSSTQLALAARRARRRRPAGGGREDPLRARALRARPLPRRSSASARSRTSRRCARSSSSEPRSRRSCASGSRRASRRACASSRGSRCAT